MGKEHWIPVVTWVRLHEPQGEPAGADDPAGFEELNSSEEVVWVNKRRR